MNPLVISGIVSFGEKIVSNIIKGHTPANKADSPSFTQYLPMNSSVKEGELVAFLKDNKVQNVSDLQDLTFRLSHQLYNHPELAQKLARLNPEEQLTLTFKDGSYSIDSSKGQIAAIRPDSELGKLARQVHQLKSITELSQKTSFSNVYQLANQVAAEPWSNKTWILRST